MKVLVDTCVWSLALRRTQAPDSAHIRELSELISELRVQMIGPIRQELLSGLRNESQYQKLRDHLRAFPDLELRTEDYERASEFFNICRGKGIQGSNTDFLICALSHNHAMPILTTDADFTLFQRHIPISLHRLREP
jgi:predicted nucleic acid-binding protein